MSREQILEERCKRFKKLLLKNIPCDAVINMIYDWQSSGEITYNDALYLAGLVELDDKNASYTEWKRIRDRVIIRDNGCDLGIEDRNFYRSAAKPPLGIMPKDMWDFIRRNAISNAIERYTMAGECIPKEWIDEYNELCKEDLTTT